MIIEQRFAALQNSGVAQPLKGRRIGLEKESLRVSRDGTVAQTPHPVALGSALTHPHITTDYSEALLELVTPAFTDVGQALRFLDNTQRFVYHQLEREILWSTSMPCVVKGDAGIPIAQYGSSNVAKMKTAYRRGLGHRYGRVMQAIAGVHYNYSYPAEFWTFYQSLLGDQRDLQTFVSESYVGMIRNLQRYGWLVPYLFGASPAICRSFLAGADTNLSPLLDNTYYGRYATSLRMGDMGYQNNKEDEAGIVVNYDSLPSYIESLKRAISTPCKAYRHIPLSDDKGVWQQLSRNILQIENEHYSSVRPKQILHGEEMPILALQRRGVAYVELRSLDINAYTPHGINEEQMRFLEAFLLFSLLSPSAPIADRERADIQRNFNEVALRGRDPQLQLMRNGKVCYMRDWARDIFSQMVMSCELLDSGRPQPLYCPILSQQREKIDHSELTPSACMLEEMIREREEFYDFSLRLSLMHQQHFIERPLEVDTQVMFERLTQESIKRQAAIEKTEDMHFEAFLANYFQQSALLSL